MTQTNQNPLPSQFTIRLGDSELEYINENLHLIRGEELDMPRSRIFANAVTKAIQNQPKEREVIKDNPEQVAKIEEQEKALNDLQTLINTFEQQFAELQEKQNDLPPGAIVLNLQPKFRQYFWAVLQVSTKQGYATTYEELLQKMFEVFNARNEFKFSEEDINYLKTLTYDGPAENS